MIKSVIPMRQKENHRVARSGSVVGIVDSPAALAVARRLPAGAVDYLEWRADALPAGFRIPDSRFPWILTVRHPAEGGLRPLTLTQRRQIFSELLPQASAVDVELRSFASLRGILEGARQQKALLIASFHDFRATPSTSRLRSLACRARDAGADVFKVATRTGTPADVSRLLELFHHSPLPLAVMGMGPLGFGSRLLLAECGSVLNYGWLHRPNVPGQWRAVELKRTLVSR
jgi:3-dehydroquinate dehydratase-1